LVIAILLPVVGHPSCFAVSSSVQRGMQSSLSPEKPWPSRPDRLDSSSCTISSNHSCFPCSKLSIEWNHGDDPYSRTWQSPQREKEKGQLSRLVSAANPTKKIKEKKQ